jgi:hypothetical protein
MYTRATWVDLVTDADAAHMNRIEDALAIPVDGHGVVDDQPKLQAFLNDVWAAGGGYAKVAPGQTCLLASTLTIPSNVHLYMNGSTLKKRSTLAAGAVDMTGDNARLIGAKVDCNKAGGATSYGISSSGAGNALKDVFVSNAQNGYGIACSAGALACRDAHADSGGTALGNCDGFAVFGTGVLDLDGNCGAVGNTRGGFFCNTTGLGHRVNGTFGRNSIAGVFIFRGDKGHSEKIFAYDNGSQNVICDPGGTGVLISDWEFGTIIAKDQGLTDVITSGANVEFIGSQRFQVGTILSKGGGGYALAFSGYGVGFGAQDCSIGTLLADNHGGIDTDPGLTFQQNSVRNHVGFASIRGHSWAVTVSEEIEPIGNDVNSIGTLHANDCPWGIIVSRGGSYVDIGEIVGRNCGTADPTLSKGLLAFRRHETAGGGNVRGHRIGYIDYKETRTTSTRPIALVWCDSTESGNTVEDGIARGCDTDVIDENGGNNVTLRPMVRQTLLDSFESGWTGGADNLTAGQFVEGTKGRRIVSNTLGTAVISHTGLSLNLSAMPDDEWFRFFVNIENASDRHASTPILVRFGTDPTGATNFWQWVVAPDAVRLNGPRYLKARKGGFAATGTPNWASITRIDIFAISAVANTFAVTFDNLERVYPDQYAKHIGGVLPHGQPVASGNHLSGTGKDFMNDAGTWKSATYT